MGFRGKVAIFCNNIGPSPGLEYSISRILKQTNQDEKCLVIQACNYYNIYQMPDFGPDPFTINLVWGNR